jgi:hypothetical protein
MVQTRLLAEYHIGMPDFGLTPQATGSHRRTATEVERVSGLMNVNVDLRARTFRLSLGALLQLAWSTLLQYDADTRYFVTGEMRALPEQALAAEGWLIQPNGSSESWNRQAQFQRALLRKQLFAQSPWINQPELDRSILELDDPRLVQRLFQDPQTRSRDEYEDEATKLPTMMLGLPLPAHPEDDQAVRIKCLLDFLKQRGVVGAPVDPVAVAAIRTRMRAHLEALAQKDPAAAKALRQSLAKLLQAHARPLHAPPAPVRRSADGRREPAADVPMPPSAASLSTAGEEVAA